MSNRIYQHAYHAGRYDREMQLLEENSNEHRADAIVDAARERQEMSPMFNPPELDDYDMIVELDEDYE